MPLELLELPDEILVRILSHARRYADLSFSARACKQLSTSHRCGEPGKAEFNRRLEVRSA